MSNSLYFDFDFNDYETAPKITQVPKSEEKQKPSVTKNKDIYSDFNFGDYEVPEYKSEEEIPEQAETWYKNLARTILQIPQGIAEGTVAGMTAGFMQLLGTGAALDEEEIEQIRKISEREGVPFDEEKYMQSINEAASMFPTVGNIARGIEHYTGLPLEPKTREQKALRFASTATKLSPEGFTVRGSNIALPRPVLGAVVAGTKETAQELGLPEPLAELGSFAILKKPTEGAGKLSIGKSRKESGLVNRRYEKIKKPTEVSESKLKQINEKTESEFREITDNILKEKPIEKTRHELKENPLFKKEVGEQFQRVEEIATSLPEKISTRKVKKKFVNDTLKKIDTGLTPSEYDKDFKKFILQIVKETPKKDISAVDLIKQYRKNNKALSEAYDPSKPYAYNRAKKDAIQEYNRSIADLIEETYPDSEFSNLFKETNKQWSEIADVQAIDKFVDSLFDGKIQHQKGKRFFESENLARPFKRSMGEEGFKEFEQLMKDLLETETPYKMLKVAQKKGYEELFKTGLSYVIHPNLGIAKVGYDIGKNTFKAAMNAIRDKPKLAITWEKGLSDLKKGNFKSAEKNFKALKEEVEAIPKEQKSIKDSETQSKKPETIKTEKEDINKAFEGLAGSMSDNFYRDTFKAIENGKSIVKDPFYDAAKINYDLGLIKSEEDLKKFGELFFNKKKPTK
jgi:hypothetical protein